MKKNTQTLFRRLMPWLFGIALLLVWQAVSTLLSDISLLLPPPTAVLHAFIEQSSAIWPNALRTLLSTSIGFALAVAVGLALGLAVGASGLVYSGVYPILVAFNAIPKVALVPIFVLWFGIGSVPAVITAFSLAVFPIVVNVATGLVTIDRETEDVMRSLGANRLEILLKVGLPRMLPYLFASLKIAITLAFVGSVLSETLASNDGIGYLIQSASANFDVPLVFAGLVLIAAMAIVAYAICALLEKRMAGWAYRSNR